MEDTLTDAVRTLIEHLGTVCIDEGSLCAFRRGVVELTSDGLLGIPDGSRHHPIELSVEGVALGDMASDGSDRTSTQGDGIAGRLAVDTVDHDLSRRTSQPQGRVTQKGIL